MTGESQPYVSVIIPCYNEIAFIERVVASVLAQDYPSERMEILVVEGGSTDGTLEVLERLVERGSVRVVPNPDRIKPIALNRGIAEARGDVIIRMDAHATYPPDYVRLSVENLVESGADNVGGYRDTQPRDDSILGRAIAGSLVSRFGSGGAVFRSGGGGRQWVDTVFGGCYWRDVFDRLGGFDPRLIRGQDREFNERLRRSGGRILFVPNIVCTYYARSDIRSFIRWTFASGVTPFLISRITGRRAFSLRNVVPPAFAVSVLVLPVIGTVWPPALLLWGAVLSTYLIAALVASAGQSLRRRDPLIFPALLLIFLLTHLTYGIGSLWGLIRPVPAGEQWTQV